MRPGNNLKRAHTYEHAKERSKGMKAVILAGGEGTRLKSVTGERPKPLVPLLGRSLMGHILLLN